jgi:hypothetical protein
MSSPSPTPANWGDDSGDDMPPTPPQNPAAPAAEPRQPRQPRPTRFTGMVTSWHARKGWGWVRRLDDSQNFFCHHSELRPSYEPLGPSWHKPCLYTGEYVEFETGVNPATRKICCKEITGINDGPLMMDHAIWKAIRYRDNTLGEDASTDE